MQIDKIIVLHFKERGPLRFRIEEGSPRPKYIFLNVELISTLFKHYAVWIITKFKKKRFPSLHWLNKYTQAHFYFLCSRNKPNI